MTATREELLSLIGRLEEAKSGDRALDVGVSVVIGKCGHLGWTCDDRGYVCDCCGFVAASYEDRPKPVWPQHYTTSIDAAMTLVPDEWDVSVWRAHSWGPEWQSAVNRGAIVAAPTAPLALCIACLKARAKLMESTP